MTKINFTEIKAGTVSPEVSEWMRQYGGNHVSLLKYWDKDTHMRDDYDLLLQQLSCALQQRRSKPVITRLLGRIRKVRSKLETESLDNIDNAPTADFLL